MTGEPAAKAHVSGALDKLARYAIGLTGDIGCGKSVVGEMLRELGAEYVDADRLVHEALAAGSPIVPQVVERFGADIAAADGGIDRRRLGAMVFADRQALQDLEALVVPSVRAEIRRRLAEPRDGVIVVDAIKLIESGLYQEVDSVWLVVCDPVEQRRRLTEHRGMTPEEVQQRISVQPPQEQKLAYAQVVIRNHGPIETPAPRSKPSGQPFQPTG